MYFYMSNSLAMFTKIGHVYNRFIKSGVGLKIENYSYQTIFL